MNNQPVSYLRRGVLVAAMLFALAGCVYAPPPAAYGPPPAPGNGYGYAYAPGYYYAPPVVGSVNLGFWGGRRWR